MGELFEGCVLAAAVCLSVWFFVQFLQGIENDGYRVGFERGVIKGAERALDPKNRSGLTVQVSIEDEVTR